MDPVNRDELAKKLVAVAYLEGDFLLASGRRSKYYFDKYRFETQPDLLGPVARLIADRVPVGTKRIAGPELGAVALAAAASLAANVPFLIVRGGQKAYGTGKQIEGLYAAGDTAVVVEDVMTSGGSAIQAARVLLDVGCKVQKIIGVIDREEGARAAVTAAGFELDAIFTRTELDRWLS
jgi:orotate phosphoribosyltransferase